MKCSAWSLAGIALLAANVAVACSSSPPSRPPVETTGGNPGVGGAGGPAKDSGAAVADSAVPVVPAQDSGGGLDGGFCTAGNCNGCCDALYRCQSGTNNQTCGVSGIFCAVCSAGTNCINGYCQ